MPSYECWRHGALLIKPDNDAGLHYIIISAMLLFNVSFAGCFRKLIRGGWDSFSRRSWRTVMLAPLGEWYYQRCLISLHFSNFRVIFFCLSPDAQSIAQVDHFADKLDLYIQKTMVILCNECFIVYIILYVILESSWGTPPNARVQGRDFYQHGRLGWSACVELQVQVCN